jgi:hypothetical protein
MLSSRQQLCEKAQNIIIPSKKPEKNHRNCQKKIREKS